MAAVILLLAAILSTLGLARLAALSQTAVLATLRLVGMTPRDIKLVVGLRSTALSLMAGLIIAPLALLLTPREASVRFLAVEYRIGELVPGVMGVLLVIGSFVIAGTVVSVLGLRRLEVEPLAVRLRQVRRVKARRAPLFWVGGILLLACVAYVAPLWRLPDAVILSLELLGIAAVLLGIGGSVAAIVGRVGRLLQRPLPVFIAGKQLSTDPGANVRTVLGVGGVALTIGLASALGPASMPSRTSPELWNDALQIRVPDGDGESVRDELFAAVGDDRVGTFVSGSFTQAGQDRDDQAFMGTCAHLARSGFEVTSGACRAGDAIHVGSDPPELGTRLDGWLSRGLDTSPTALRVSGAAQSSGQSWLLLVTEAVPSDPDTFVVYDHGNEAVLSAVLAATTRSGSAFEIVVPQLDRLASAFQYQMAQDIVDALSAWLVALAAVASMAGVIVSVVERRSLLTSLRYVGLSRAALASSVAVTVATPLVVVAAFGGLSGYLVGVVFGRILDGRAPGPLTGALVAMGVLTLASVILGGAVGSAVAASSRSEPQDARLT